MIVKKPVIHYFRPKRMIQNFFLMVGLIIDTIITPRIIPKGVLLKRFYALFFTSLFSLSLLNAAPEVVSITPTPESLTAQANQPVTITFDRPLNPGSVDNDAVHLMGRWSGVCPGTISLSNGDSVLNIQPNRPFSAGEWVTVQIGKSLQDLSGNEMATNYSFVYWIATRPTSMALMEVDRIPVREEGEGWIQTYGANALDLNGDGFSDYTVPNERSNDIRIFLNDGFGNYDQFTIFELPDASRPSTNEAADFNGDGIADLAIGNTSNDSINVCYGDGQGGFSTITSWAADQSVRGLSVLDVEV